MCEGMICGSILDNCTRWNRDFIQLNRYRFSRINIIYLQGKDRRFSRGRKRLIKLSFRYIAIVRMKRCDKLQRTKFIDRLAILKVNETTPRIEGEIYCTTN